MKQKRFQAVRAAIPRTLPVMTGYVFLGMAFGILLTNEGYGLPWALLMSVFIFAGSMQFVAVGLLAGGFGPVSAFLLTLMVNFRHFFYGISMLERYKPFRKTKPYLIFGLTDETFSLLVQDDAPEGVDAEQYALAVTLLDQLYWVAGSALGSVLGGALPVDMTGIDFAMTALFVVIFLSQWEKRAGRVPALIGVGAAVLCLLIFGAEWFLLPTLALLTALLLLLRPALDERGTLQ